MGSAFLWVYFLFYSNLSIKLLLLLLWLIVHLIYYSNISQLTTVQLSCVLHIEN